MYGHRSRIWAVRETAQFLASVSEDATCKLWLKGQHNEKPFETLKGHSGKNVRALATFHSGNNDIDIIATGGEDGAIKVYDLLSIIEQKTFIEEEQNTI